MCDDGEGDDVEAGEEDEGCESDATRAAEEDESKTAARMCLREREGECGPLKRRAEEEEAELSSIEASERIF